MKIKISQLYPFLLLLLLSACTDHVTPDKIAPIIVTLKYSDDPDEQVPHRYYKVSFTELGNRPVTEYGVVLRASPENDSSEPTVSDVKKPFSSPVASATTLTQSVLLAEEPELTGVFRYSYRAYAITDDGAVVYGSTFSTIYAPL
nr:hypothetical protein [uncultured Dyadobacter sp.]